MSAGKISRISLAVPPGERKVTWDPGDGSPPVVAAELAHAWQKPGRYQVAVNVDGRRAELWVDVQSRPVLDVVPGGVKLALVVPQPWKLLPRILGESSRLSFPLEARRSLRRMEKVGFDPKRPEAIEEKGLDPHEGLAVVVIPEDPEGAWLLLGAVNVAKALALGKELTGMEGAVERDMEGARFALGQDADGNAVAYGVAGGYLMLRLPSTGEQRQLGAAAVHLSMSPEGGLGAEPEFVRARALAAGDDAIFYAQPRSVRALTFAAGHSDDPAAMGALVMGLTVTDTEFSLTAGLPLDRETAADLLRTFRASRAPARYAEQSPAGAAVFLALSVSPQRILDRVFAEPMERAAAEAAAMEAFGLRLTETVSVFSGNLALAVYLDAEALLGSAMSAARGEAPITPSNTPPLLLQMEMATPVEARAALGPAFERLGAIKAKSGNRFSLDSGSADFQGDTLRVTTGNGRALLDKPPGGTALADAIGREVLEKPGEQVLYLDVAAIVDGLGKARPGEVDQLAAQALLRSQLEALAPLKDVLLHGGATAGGIEARLRVRLRQVAAAP